jgi:hypothetical protein
MQIEHDRLTDTLERELSAREADTARGIALDSAARTGLRRILSAATALADAMALLRRQAHDAKVDYAAG